MAGTVVAVIALGYFLGSCPWGYWLVRIFRGEDIRRRGSGNIGITNVWRLYGKRFGVPILILDVGKGFVPALLGLVLVSEVAGIAAGAAAMLGHWRPPFLRFQRGGKMMATGGGTFLAVAPLATLTATVIWIVVFLCLGYASVASLSTAVFMPIGSWAYGYPTSVVVFGAVALVSITFLHRANLARLRRGTENQSRIAVVRKLNLQRQ